MEKLRAIALLGFAVFCAIADAQLVVSPPQLRTFGVDLISATQDGGMVVSGYATLGQYPASLTTSTAAGDVNTLPANSLQYGPYGYNAACIAYNFSSNFSTVDVFLSSQEGLSATLDFATGTFNNSNVVRLNNTALDGVRNGSALAAVNVTDSYALVAENTGGQVEGSTTNTGNSTQFGYLMIAYPHNASECADAKVAGTPPLETIPIDDSNLSVYLYHAIPLAQKEARAVAVFANVSCIAYQLNGQDSDSITLINSSYFVNASSQATADITTFLTSEAASLQWINAGLVDPVPYLGALCYQAKPGPTSGPSVNAATGAVLSYNSTAPGLIQVNTNVSISTEQTCQMVVDGLDTTQLYILWAVNGENSAQGEPATASMSFAARTQGSCASLQFDPLSALPPLLAPAPSPAQAPGSIDSISASSGKSSVSGGAIAGIIIGVLAVLVILASAALVALRRRRRSQRASRDVPLTALKGTEEEAEVLNAGPGGSQRRGDGLPTDDEPGDVVGTGSKKTVGGSNKNGSSGPDAGLDFAKGWNWNRGVKSPFEDDSRAFEPPAAQGTAPIPEEEPLVGRESLRGRTPSNSVLVVQRGVSGSVRVTISHKPDKTASLQESGHLENIELPELPFRDWEMDPKDIEYTLDAEGNREELGSGSYGSVYTARLSKAHNVAVKEFKETHSAQQQLAVMMEVAILKNCHSPHIVQFMGACIKDKKIVLIMERMECDLYQAIHSDIDPGSPLSFRWYHRGKRVALEIAKGLHYLHWRKLIHFDLKSGNVLINAEGSAKITDVGFANILGDGKANMAAGGWTLAYAAPEVLLSKPCTSKCDIFSLGVVLYEIVTGHTPRRGSMRTIEVPGDCPQEIKDLIESCLATEADDRPSALDVVNTLEKLQ